MILVALLVVIGIIGALTADQGGEPSTMGDGQNPPATAGCQAPAPAWISAFEDGGFDREFRDARVTDSAYVAYETTQGTAYYVAIKVDTSDSVAVFGTSQAPLGADFGLIAAANPAAEDISTLGADIPPDSSAGELLKDGLATNLAEQCLG